MSGGTMDRTEVNMDLGFGLKGINNMEGDINSDFKTNSLKRGGIKFMHPVQFFRWLLDNIGEAYMFSYLYR